MKRLVPSSLYGDYPAQLLLLTTALPNGCWEFTGYVNPNGYGQLGRNLGAHRVAWEVSHGRPVPAGLVIDHQCHNLDLSCNDDTECPHRRCVNPTHLEAVTDRTNILRGHSPTAAVNAIKTECDRGHEFTPENTYYRPDRFGRVCRICRDEALARGRQKWAEANRDREAARRRRLNPDDFAIREWAMASGLKCSMSGPISRAVRNAYTANLARTEAA